MKIPDKCPWCGDIMLTSFVGRDDRMVRKYCKLRIDHQISILGSSASNEITVFNMSLSMNPRVDCFWSFPYGDVWITVDDQVKSFLPWFEPDLSDCRVLKEKVKTYLVFS